MSQFAGSSTEDMPEKLEAERDKTQADNDKLTQLEKELSDIQRLLFDKSATIEKIKKRVVDDLVDNLFSELLTVEAKLSNREKWVLLSDKEKAVR